EPRDAAGRVVGIERRQVEESDGSQQPGGLPVLLDGAAPGQCLGPALQSRAIQADALDPVGIEREAGVALVGDVLRRRAVDDSEGHRASTSAGMSCSSVAAPCTAIVLVCSCELVSSDNPAPMLVIEEQAQTRSPS